jgi:hypothetical protein
LWFTNSDEQFYRHNRTTLPEHLSIVMIGTIISKKLSFINPYLKVGLIGPVFMPNFGTIASSYKKGRPNDRGN